MIVLVGGGARSGKSRFALRRAEQLGDHRVFVATAEARDEEMRARVARHVAERGDRFRTVEAPVQLVQAVQQLQLEEVAVIDCLTFWLANLLMAGQTEAAVEQQVAALTDVLAARSAPTIVVTNEVGMGIVPESALGRQFRDVAGRAHQSLAVVAQEVYAGIVGTMLRLKPAPIAATFEGESHDLAC